MNLFSLDVVAEIRISAGNFAGITIRASDFGAILTT
jgi:hypothetical protein